QPMQAIIMPYGIYPDMGVHNIEDFVQPEPAVEGFTFEWSLTAPEGSTAELITGAVAIFQVDVEGQYDLVLTATDAEDNTAETTWTVFASTYIGVGGLTGVAPAMPECGTCHADQARAWYATGHASMFVRGIEGELGDHYGPDCIRCHTTGYDALPEAVNNGFDDRAAEAGWTFPAELNENNWEAMVAEFPNVAAMANIQCESCHGPGGAHTSSMNPQMIGGGLSYGVCAQCHAEGPYHTVPQQWELSAHATKNARAFWYPIGEEHAECVRCHSGAGYIDFVSGLSAEEQRTEYQVITCAVCHDPHNAANPNQLRTFDLVTLPSGVEVTDAGPAATCMTCHNARVGAVESVDGAVGGGEFSTPHYSTGAEMMTASGSYTWGEELPTSPHGWVVEESCVGCHMAASPGVDDMGTADDASDDQPLAGHETVGGHTFSMVSPVDETENVAVCQTCHDGVESFEFEAFRDYDGDGTIETNQAEVEGLRKMLTAALTAAGVGVLESYPYFEIPEGADVNVYGGVWNLKFTESGGAAVHNLRYTVAALQLSIEKLTGEPVPGAYILTAQ
ncbi:MAG: hypothetical protein EHM39_08120, partial [Chloroflexi bacterium]